MWFATININTSGQNPTSSDNFSSLAATALPRSSLNILLLPTWSVCVLPPGWHFGVRWIQMGSSTLCNEKSWQAIRFTSPFSRCHCLEWPATIRRESSIRVSLPVHPHLSCVRSLEHLNLNYQSPTCQRLHSECGQELIQVYHTTLNIYLSWLHFE